MTLNNKVYDALKWIVISVLPALAVFVKAVFPVWNLPYADEISTTITAVVALLGTMLGISTVNYMTKLNTTDSAEDSAEDTEESVEDLEAKG